MKKTILFACMLFLNYNNFFAQNLCTVNGYDLSPHGKLNILFIFAEVDCNTCPNPNSGDPNNPTPLSPGEICVWGNGNWEPYQLPEWPKGELPVSADDWIDYDPDQAPTRHISKFYEAVSFGDLTLTGDYYPDVLTVPCSLFVGNSEGSQVQAVLTQLNEEYGNNNPNFITTARGMYNLEDFDLIANEEGLGEVKPQIPNGEIDAICIIWRNYKIASDYAFQGFGNGTLLNDPNSQNPMSAVTASSWDDPTGDGFALFIAEIFHPMYGGNNWHTAGGAGRHTFPFNPSNISITGQSPAASSSVCGWDRQMLGWTSLAYNPASVAIPVTNISGGITSGDLSIETLGSGITEQTFILRDHFTTGDALRIKLPHIASPVKNQYLWIENRQLVSEFDVQKQGPPCQDTWVPGLYPYIQVGKDVQCANTSNELYGGGNSNPNSLGSFLFPVSAEGSYDYYYDINNLDNIPNQDCVIGLHIPKVLDHPETLLNPFTGASDLYPTKYDENGDGGIGYLDLDDAMDIGNAEKIGGVIDFNNNYHGDSEDAFRLGGNSKLGIGTNPSFTPLYTRTSGPHGGGGIIILIC